MRLFSWALVCAAGLLATRAEARDHALHPVASAASIPDLLTLTPREIDVSRPDYTIVVEIRNDTDEWLQIPMAGVRCVRGDLEILAEGRHRALVLAPWQARELKLRCDHGRWVTGDFGIVLPQIAASATDDRRAPTQVMVEHVIWGIREEDVSRRQQRGADGSLARLSYCFPTVREAIVPDVPAPAEPSDGLPATATLSVR